MTNQPHKRTIGNEYETPREGTVVKVETGKLYVFKSSSISVMVAWPQPAAWKKTRRHNWARFRPHIHVPSGDLEGRIRRLELNADDNGQLMLPCCLPVGQKIANRVELAWLRWYATIPAQTRKLVSRFPNRQFHVLSFLARCGDAAVDLAISNPALAFALASNWVYHRPAVQRPLRSARALLKPGKKQRDILAWLGFPGTEAARKMLAKTVHKAVSIPSLLYMRQGMTDPAMFKAMSHVSRLNAGAIRIATDPGLLKFAMPRLLDEIAHRREEDKHAKAAYMLQDSVAMFRLLHQNGRDLQPIRSLSQLSDVHENLVDSLNRADELDMEIPFPPPPVAGTDCIVPITNARDLVNEGRDQHNCVASYMDRIALHQKVYIYQVLSPERCTLAISCRGNAWVPTELKRACNLLPSKTTHNAVAEWLGCKTLDTTWHPPTLECDEVPF